MEMERYGRYRSRNLSYPLRGGKVDLIHSCIFTAVAMGGKDSFSSFPPLWAEEKWIHSLLQLYRCY